jgi:DNA-binding GntR family transcriptional regulator
MSKIRTSTRLGADDLFSETLQQLGRALYMIREISGLSQTELATAVNRFTGGTIDQSTISRVEQGRNRYLDWRELFAACRVLDCSVDHIFELALQVTRDLRSVNDGSKTHIELLEQVGHSPRARMLSRQSFYPAVEKGYRHLRRHILLGGVLNGEVTVATPLLDDLKLSKNDVHRVLEMLQVDGCIDILGEDRFIVPEYSVRHMISIVCRRIEIEARAAMAMVHSAEREAAFSVVIEIHDKMQGLACRLRNNRGDAEQNSLRGEFAECDIDFHLALLQQAEYLPLQGELKRLIVQVLVGTQTMTIGSRPEEVIDEHTSIIGAIESGVPRDIIGAMIEHMIGNARQWEGILRDRLAQNSNVGSDRSDAERFERERMKFRRFKELVSENCSKIFGQ